MCGSVSPLVSVCVFFLYCCPLLLRWAYGAGHRGDHGGDPPVAPGDERLHRHMRAARPTRESGACLFTVGGGEVHCE